MQRSFTRTTWSDGPDPDCSAQDNVDDDDDNDDNDDEDDDDDNDNNKGDVMRLLCDNDDVRTTLWIIWYVITCVLTVIQVLVFAECGLAPMSYTSVFSTNTTSDYCRR